MHLLAIYCFKKALFLIHAIAVRFGSMAPPPFPIPATTQIPVFTDNVLPSLLIHLGVITLTEPLSALFPGAGSKEQLTPLLGAPPPPSDEPSTVDKKKVVKDGPTLSHDQAYILRAAAIDACEIMAMEAKQLQAPEGCEWINKATLPDLDMWIWAVAKDRLDYRQLERFVLRDTVFF
jgi:hypothetical protein